MRAGGVVGARAPPDAGDGPGIHRVAGRVAGVDDDGEDGVSRAAVQGPAAVQLAAQSGAVEAAVGIAEEPEGLVGAAVHARRRDVEVLGAWHRRDVGQGRGPRDRDGEVGDRPGRRSPGPRRVLGVADDAAGVEDEQLGRRYPGERDDVAEEGRGEPDRELGVGGSAVEAGAAVDGHPVGVGNRAPRVGSDADAQVVGEPDPVGADGEATSGRVEPDRRDAHRCRAGVEGGVVALDTRTDQTARFARVAGHRVDEGRGRGAVPPGVVELADQQVRGRRVERDPPAVTGERLVPDRVADADLAAVVLAAGGDEVSVDRVAADEHRLERSEPGVAGREGADATGAVRDEDASVGRCPDLTARRGGAGEDESVDVAVDVVADRTRRRGTIAAGQRGRGRYPDRGLEDERRCRHA